MKTTTQTKKAKSAKSIAASLTLEDMVSAARQRGMRLEIELVPKEQAWWNKQAEKSAPVPKGLWEAHELLGRIPDLHTEIALKLAHVDAATVRPVAVRRLAGWLQLVLDDLKLANEECGKMKA